MKTIVDIIKKSDAAYLATVNQEGFPEIRALLNLVNPTKYPTLQDKTFIEDGENLTLYFTTNTHSRKIQQLRNNSKCSMYFCQPNSFKGVCLVGEMEEVADQDFKSSLWLPDWTMYYHEGPTDPDYSVLKFTSKSIHSWHSLKLHNFGQQLP